jgi:ribonucleoside-diphosphate reductase alpha chain
MHAVRQNRSFDLTFKNRIWKTVRARSLWAQIVEKAWRNGEPGLLFLDTINRAHPLGALGTVSATNPCGEQPLLPYGSCNLGAINLSRMVQGHWLEEPARIDWEKLEDTAQKAVHFLDAVITVNRYPVVEIERMTLKTRQIGLGIMGFADLCIKLHIRYGSTASIHLAQEIMQFVYDKANQTSIKLGREKGVAPVYHEVDLRTPRRRNASLTTIAPTGTISIIADCSSGCEPHYAFEYTKTCLQGEQLAVIPAVMREWRAAKDSQPPPPCFVAAPDVSMEEHIRIQAAFQNNGVDAAVSKTINAPSETTHGQISDAFMLAWQLGCKGLTFYRSGSRREQPLTEMNL